MDDDLVAAEALQLEEVLRLSAHSCTTACAVCRMMIISVEASWKPENCDHVICIDCFATHTTEAVATEMPKCPVCTGTYRSEPEIHEDMDVEDDGSLIAIKEIDDGNGNKSHYDVPQELGQCSSSTTVCAVCKLMIVSLDASWKPENCDHVICIACFAIHTSESSKCPVAFCGNKPEAINVDDDGGAGSSTSVRVLDRGKGKQTCDSKAIKEIDDGKGNKAHYDVRQELGQCSSGTTICAVCKLMIVSLDASWKPENCDHVICIACFAIHTSESSKCPVAFCGNKPEAINVDDDGGAGSSTSVRVMDRGKGKQPCDAMLQEFSQCSRSGDAMIISDFYCTICMEDVPPIECFPVGGCTHVFCVSCLRQYIAAKVEENVVSIGCPDPGCKDGSLHPEECRDVIPLQLFQKWGAALCDMAIGTLKFYCPFNDCSVLLVDDHRDGDAAITNVECPHCSRMFCAPCKVPWHDGVNCAEFQRLGDDERGREDLLLRKVAQKSKWQRCPKCKMYVERADGCVYIVCRCSHRFCYLCGSAMVKGNHHCSKCKRTW